jgi:hypothetical protein
MNVGKDMQIKDLEMNSENFLTKMLLKINKKFYKDYKSREI